jgi:hypothetical protein
MTPFEETSPNEKPMRFSSPRYFMPNLQNKQNKISPDDPFFNQLTPKQLIIHKELERVDRLKEELQLLLDSCNKESRGFVIFTTFLVDLIGSSTPEGILLNGYFKSNQRFCKLSNNFPKLPPSIDLVKLPNKF